MTNHDYKVGEESEDEVYYQNRDRSFDADDNEASDRPSGEENDQEEDDGGGEAGYRDAQESAEASTVENGQERAAARRKKQYAVSTRWERQVAEGRVEKDINFYVCCCARRVGNMFVLAERTDGSPIVIAGPCWPYCSGVTLPLILGISGLVSYFIVLNPSSDLPTWVAAIYFPVVAFVLVALFCVGCRDPGLMERVTDEEAGEGGWFWNEQVGSYRPPKALYCRECGVLIQEYDHLCPWTGTAIGKNNMLSFKVFVVAVNVLCYLSIILVAVVLLKGLAA